MTPVTTWKDLLHLGDAASFFNRDPRPRFDRRDYGTAWKSLGKAAELRGTDSRVRVAQEDLAMAWLDDIRGDQGPAPLSAG